MAVLGKIRKRVGLVIGFVGVSLLLFILGDVVTNNSGLLGGSSDLIGEIGGQKIHFQEFEKRFETLSENYKVNAKTENIDPNTQEMLREQAWSMFVNENVLVTQYKKLGLSCSPEELYEQCTGKNPNQQVKQAFTDPNTGQFDPNAVIRFLKDLPNREEAIQRQWRTFEEAIKEERIGEKYKNLIKNGFFITTEEAKRNYEENEHTASIRFVRLDFVPIADTAVKFEDSELKAYYNENKFKYKQAETIRKAEFITFDVSPSSEDREQVMNWINEKKNEFGASTSDILFVNQNSDTPFDSAFHSRGNYKPEIDSVLFSSPIGTMVGPIEEGGGVKIWKLSNEKMVADSVKARHILIKIENNDTTRTLATADSIKNAIKKGSKFEDLAKIFSQDPGSAVKGGDLGWFRQGMMVPQFNDACFNGKKGDIPIVTTQFGVHIIQIMDKGTTSKQIQVAVVERKIDASQKTYDLIYNKANEFASKNTSGENFDSSIVKMGFNKRIADNIKENDKNIAGLDQPRELIRWAYSSKKGDVSKVFTFGDKYVVAHLVDIREKGYLPLEVVKDQVAVEVRKLKKAELLTEKLNKAKATTIDEIAQKTSTSVVEADNVSMANPFIVGVGNEPNLVGTIFTLKANQISKPIKGENAVFQIVVKNFKEAAPTKEYTSNIKQLSDQLKSRSENEVFNALKEKANIEDNRGRFY